MDKIVKYQTYKSGDLNSTQQWCNDIKDIVIIIPDVKDRILAIRLSWFFVLKKQGIIPSVVDSPAKVVIKSDCFIFILNSMYNLFIN